jgi:hypothetical protein
MVAAAQELGLAAAVGQEWWAVVQEAVLLNIEAYWPAQLVKVLQCMAAAKFQPDVASMELQWMPAVSGWFVSSSSSSSGGGGSRSRRVGGKVVRGQQAAAAPLTVPQLIDLLEVLAQLSHKPKELVWWEGYQETLQQQCEALQQQQQQQQQEGVASQQQGVVLAAEQIVRVIWSTGKLRLEPKSSVLSWLLQQLEQQPQQLQQLSSKQCVDLFVGLNKLVPKTPGVLNPKLYRDLCELLPARRLGYKDISNLIRCMGGIADSVAGGGVSGALISAALSGGGSSSSSKRQRQQQQQQLIAPESVVLHLLGAVEAYLDKLQGRALSMLLWGVRKMAVHPPENWLRR